LEYISVNKVFVLEHGSLVNEGGEDLAMKIKKDGFLGS
jgi:Fe-S cluster assembly ATPase SufC